MDAVRTKVNKDGIEMEAQNNSLPQCALMVNVTSDVVRLTDFVPTEGCNAGTTRWMGIILSPNPQSL